MFALGNSLRYHLYRGHCDMRKSFNGLCGLVRNELGRQPGSGDVFVFINRRRTLIKLLHWQRGGYVLYYKRLESGTFPRLPATGHASLISWMDLVLMIEGIRVEKAKVSHRYEDKKSGFQQRRNEVFASIQG